MNRVQGWCQFHLNCLLLKWWIPKEFQLQTFKTKVFLPSDKAQISCTSPPELAAPAYWETWQQNDDDHQKPKRHHGTNIYGNLPCHATYHRLSPYTGNRNWERHNFFSGTEITVHRVPLSRAALHYYSLAANSVGAKLQGSSRALRYTGQLFEQPCWTIHLASQQQARRPCIQWAQAQEWQVVWRSHTPLKSILGG